MTTETRIAELQVNGSRFQVDAGPDRSLLGVLRDDLGLTGTKYGCGEGRCGACMVLIDGHAQPSCVTQVGNVAGQSITTIEGIAQDGELHPVQQAFLEVGAMQCGYCTPGMIVSAVALLEANPDPTEAEIVAAMDRHICRCGVYPRIVSAIRRAAERLRDSERTGAVR